MEAAIKQSKKRCPVCAREYAEDDNYCGNDGSLLEQQAMSTGDSGDV